METFSKNLRDRADVLGMSNAEVAEKAGLDARRYGHYVTGRNEPDLGTFVRIARVLKTSPNLLLGFDDKETTPKVERLVAAAHHLREAEIEMLINFAEATLKKR